MTFCWRFVNLIIVGHSVASTASAKILTQLLGDNIRFIDDTEVEFGIKERKFKSFNQAAEEASISRLYGGLHYRDGIDSGVWQGKEVGTYILNKLYQMSLQISPK